MQPYAAMEGSGRMRLGKPPKKLDHIEVKEGDGKELLAHLRQHLNIKVAKKDPE